MLNPAPGFIFLLCTPVYTTMINAGHMTKFMITWTKVSDSRQGNGCPEQGDKVSESSTAVWAQKLDGIRFDCRPRVFCKN